MASRKRKNRRIKKMTFLKTESAPVENLTDKWYTTAQVLKILDISISTCKRRRKTGLVASKKFGKIYFNDYYVQKYLRDGLKSITIFMTALGQFTDGCEGLFAA